MVMMDLPPMRIPSFVFRSLVLVVCTAPSLAWGAEPKAVLLGPDSAAPGQVSLLKFTGTISDSDPVILQVSGPADAGATVVYSKSGQPACAILQPPVSGDYLFVLAAIGTPPGATAPAFAFAAHVVRVGLPGPSPSPTPGPTPSPNPGPSPTPQGPGVAIGAAYASFLVATDAAAWSAFADALEGGKSYDESKAIYQSAWRPVLASWLKANFQPSLAAIWPGTADPTPAQRAAIAALARGIAAGEGGAK